MAIEFNCPSCGKLLKTKDDKAGLKARCPDCGTAVTVPGPSEVVDDPEVVDEADPWDSSAKRPMAREEEAVEEPDDEADIGAAIKSCPMCGKQIRAAAQICRYCGERFGERASSKSVRPTTVSIGDVIGTAWAQFKQQGVMICIGGVIVFALLIVAAVVAYFLVIAVTVGIVAGMGPDAARGGPPPEFFIALVVLGIIFGLFFMVLNAYLMTGYWAFLLNIARGRDPELGDLFSGGRFLLRAVGAALVVGVVSTLFYAITLGPGLYMSIAMPRQNQELQMLLQIIGMALYYPGLAYLQMRMLPWTMYLVDQDCGAMDALQGSLAITAPNHLAQFVLVPVMFMALYLGGGLMCCVGVMVTMPFFCHLQAVGYLMMCGRTVRAAD